MRRAALILAVALSASPAAAQLGASCTPGSWGGSSADTNGNNWYCNGNTDTVTTPAYQFSSTSTGCSSGTAGTVQWTGTTITPNNTLEFCNGSSWLPVYVTAPDGYIVLSKGTYTGNLGGQSGADALCLTELTTNTGWMGYSTANSEGLLVSGNVHGYMCSDSDLGGTGECATFLPSTTYIFANAGNSSAGGATMTTDQFGWPPFTFSSTWAGSTYFDGDYLFWTGNNAYSPYAPQEYNTCDGFTISNNSNTGEAGYTDVTNPLLYYTYLYCDYSPVYLLCFVNP